MRRAGAAGGLIRRGQAVVAREERTVGTPDTVDAMRASPPKSHPQLIECSRESGESGESRSLEEARVHRLDRKVN